MLFYIIIFVIIFFDTVFYNRSNVNVYVQLSAGSLSYFLYLPIVVKAWKLFGCSCIVIIVYHNLSKDIIYVKKQLINLDSEVILIKLNNSVSLHYASKLSRIFGYMASRKTKSNDFLFLSDADMIPLSKSFFNNINFNKLTIKSFGPDGYGFGNNRGRWAMCYMVGNKFIWNAILKNDTINKNIERVILNTLNIQLEKGERYYENYLYLDEVYLRDKIRKWNNYGSHILFHIRNFNRTRIDRSKWPKNISLINKNRIIDIHLPKLPKKFTELIHTWKTKIIPLQMYIFNDIPYDIKYIEKILSFNN